MLVTDPLLKQHRASAKYLVVAALTFATPNWELRPLRPITRAYYPQSIVPHFAVSQMIDT
jgi:hypothetical protein